MKAQAKELFSECCNVDVLHKKAHRAVKNKIADLEVTNETKPANSSGSIHPKSVQHMAKNATTATKITIMSGVVKSSPTKQSNCSGYG